MYVYKDVFTGDELFSDSYKITEIDGCVYRVESSFKQKGEEDFGIAHNTDEDEGDTGGYGGAGAETVNEVVDAFKLQKLEGYTKKDYLAHIKRYMAQLKNYVQNHNPDRLEDFQKQVQAYVKKVASRFDEYDFFQGESLDENGMVVLQDFSEDGMTPYLYYFKDGVVAEKV
jgi:hypothetical protein